MLELELVQNISELSATSHIVGARTGSKHIRTVCHKSYCWSSNWSKKYQNCLPRVVLLELELVQNISELSATSHIVGARTGPKHIRTVCHKSYCWSSNWSKTYQNCLPQVILLELELVQNISELSATSHTVGARTGPKHIRTVCHKSYCWSSNWSKTYQNCLPQVILLELELVQNISELSATSHIVGARTGPKHIRTVCHKSYCWSSNWSKTYQNCLPRVILLELEMVQNISELSATSHIVGARTGPKHIRTVCHESYCWSSNWSKTYQNCLPRVILLELELVQNISELSATSHIVGARTGPKHIRTVCHESYCWSSNWSKTYQNCLPQVILLELELVQNISELSATSHIVEARTGPKHIRTVCHKSYCWSSNWSKTYQNCLPQVILLELELVQNISELSATSHIVGARTGPKHIRTVCHKSYCWSSNWSKTYQNCLPQVILLELELVQNISELSATSHIVGARTGPKHIRTVCHKSYCWSSNWSKTYQNCLPQVILLELELVQNISELSATSHIVGARTGPKHIRTVCHKSYCWSSNEA